MQAQQTIDLTSEHLISAIEFTLQFDEPNPIAHFIGCIREQHPELAGAMRRLEAASRKNNSSAPS